MKKITIPIIRLAVIEIQRKHISLFYKNFKKKVKTSMNIIDATTIFVSNNFNMKENPTGTVLYTIEQTIKEYRKIAQKNIGKIVNDITVDQCLLLIILNENPDYSQKEIAKLIFKDNTSVTRIIELMVKKDYITRKINELDRRKFSLEITEKGKNTIELLSPIILQNREIALEDLSQDEIDFLDKTLRKIILNCKK